MMGSLAYAGGLVADKALDIIGMDGSRLGAELERIGYAGTEEPGFLKPAAYLELHIEQGPVLEREGLSLGAVENLQGISWQRITIEGVANHAGTTPMAMRHDAGYAAATITAFLHDPRLAVAIRHGRDCRMYFVRAQCDQCHPREGRIHLDLRDPDELRLQAEEQVLADELKRLVAREGVTISAERLARFVPVIFDRKLVEQIETAAAARGLTTRRMTSGAGHDAQMISRIAPAAMIFVPSMGGISHSPKEFTPAADLVAGANVLLDVVRRLASR